MDEGMSAWFARIVAPNGNGRDGVEGVSFRQALRVTAMFLKAFG